jgi:hypothetical protein
VTAASFPPSIPNVWVFLAHTAVGESIASLGEHSVRTNLMSERCLTLFDIVEKLVDEPVIHESPSRFDVLSTGARARPIVQLVESIEDAVFAPMPVVGGLPLEHHDFDLQERLALALQ